jgi:DNA-binding transcriptional LysR family regulator
MSKNAKQSRKNATPVGRRRRPELEPSERPSLAWDDLELILALGRGRSLAAAGTRLAVNTSTVARRLDALEARIGVPLFDRSPTGMAATELAEALMPVAETVERSVADALRLVEHRETEPEGLVRVTAPPGLANWFVAPALVGLRTRYPELTVQLDAAIGYADLTRREADIALRGARPQTGDLVAVRVLEARSVLAVAPALANRLGPLPRLDAIDWITWGPELAGLPDARWLTANVDGQRVALRTSSMDAQIQAARAGLGALVVPEPFLAWVGLVELPLKRALTRRLPPLPSGALWMVGHRALREVPRVRAVWEFLLAEARALAARG